MNLPLDQQKILEKFPPVLRSLLDAEIAAGNTLAEIDHGFPAPPVGACAKLARKVGTRPRASGGGLDFRARNSSLSAGEFTDAQRIYFVVEPPDPSPPEPDMDAIRRALEPPESPLTKLAARRAGTFAVPGRNPPPPAEAFSLVETATGATRTLHFLDPRPPTEVQRALERNLTVLFTAALVDASLCFRAKGVVIGTPYAFELRFTAVSPRGHSYTLRVETSWAETAPVHLDYVRKTAGSWFESWTRELVPATPPDASSGDAERYRQLCDETLAFQAQPETAESIQRAIVDGMKRGGTFSNSHKEGGTRILWREGRFVRSDYGDCPDLKEYTDEAEFLKMLRQFCEWDVQRHAGKEPLPELDVWKLIQRRMGWR